MGFIKLPSNSEKILLELAQAENPTQALNAHYEGCSIRERSVLDGIVRELIECGYINVQWADDMPWIVTLNNSARTYGEQLSEHEAPKAVQVQHETRVKNIIFISHRSTDKDIADMLVDFFVGTGIPKKAVFCSSLPGNDINEKIASEVKAALKNSAVNIAILSQDYYQSAYCLNEAGVLWYCDDVPVIPIALPEINSNNMFGFLSNEYKLRRLDSDGDISYIYDTVSESVSAPPTKHRIITRKNQKLKERYAMFLGARAPVMPTLATKPAISTSKITTDDERIVLYYILKMNVRKVSKDTIRDWLHKSEIYDVNVDNAFDLLTVTFRVRTKDEINVLDLSNFVLCAAKLLSEDHPENVHVKTTLHSPGDIILQIADFFQQNPLLLPICYMAIFGGKVGNYEFNSLLGVIKGFINRKYENDKKAVELRKLSAEADLAEQQALRQKLDNLETMRKLQLSSVDDYAEPLATAAKNLEIQPSSATIIDITEILKSHQEDQQPQ